MPTFGYPTGADAPTVAAINGLKQLISEKLPGQFPAEVLDEDYGVLDHADESCNYDPYEIYMKPDAMVEHDHFGYGNE